MPFDLDPNTLENLFTILTAFFGAFLAALWLSLVFWTIRDVRGRSRDRILIWISAIVVAILNLPGVLIYLILRPPYTLDEVYQQTLEEEALLAQIEDRPTCPGCTAAVKPNWLVCPNCLTRLKKSCQQCGEPMDLPWQICPVCASTVPGARIEPPQAANHNESGE
jgi:hypothetical protein